MNLADFISPMRICLGLVVGVSDEYYDVFVANLLPVIDPVKISDRDAIPISQLNNLNAENVTIAKEVIEKNTLRLNTLAIGNMTAPAWKKNDVVYVAFMNQNDNSGAILPFINPALTTGPKTERVQMTVNSKENDDDAEKPNNAYSMTMDGSTKSIVMQTTSANGESTSWKFYMNGKDGKAGIQDSNGNNVQISTEDKSVLMINDAGATIGIKGQNCVISAPGELKIDAKTINVKAQSYTTDIQKMTQKINNLEEEISQLKQEIENSEEKISNRKLSGDQSEISTQKIKYTTQDIDAKSTTLEIMKITTDKTKPNAPFMDASGFSSAGMTGKPLVTAPDIIQILMMLATGIDAKVPPSPGAIVGAISALLNHIMSQTAKG